MQSAAPAPAPPTITDLFSARPAATAVAPGTLFDAVDTGAAYLASGGNWYTLEVGAGVLAARLGLGLDVSAFGAAGDGTDQSAAVLLAIASLGALTAGQVIDLWLPPGTSANPKVYQLALGAIGSIATGVKLKVRGADELTTFVEPASAVDPCFTYQGGPGSDSDGWELSGFTLRLPAHRPYDKPLIVVNQARNGDVDINLACTGDANFTGTFIQTDGAYQSRWAGSWRSNKFAVPIEVLDHQVRPGGTIPPVIDTSTFSPVITGCFGALLRTAEDAGNSYQFDNYKLVSTNFYPLAGASVEQLLASASLAGSTVLHLVDATGINASDAIAIDYESGAGHAEANKVVSVVGNDLNLAQPLVYDHDPVARGAAIPVIVGGWAAVIGDSWHTPKFVECHFEGPVVGAMLGSVRAPSFDGIYSAVGDVIRPLGNTRDVWVGPVHLRGRSDRNNVLFRPTYAIGTTDGLWYIDGPFSIDSAPGTVAPLYGETHTSRDWEIAGNTDNGHMTRRYNHGTGTGTSRMHWGTLASGAMKWGIYGSGRIVAVDGVQTFYVAGAGKTTMTDGDCAVVPTDGCLAVVRDTTTGIVRFFVRANGAWSFVTPGQEQEVYRTTDTAAVLSSTVLVSDDTLIIPGLVAGAVYAVEAFLPYDASQAGDVKYGWLTPAASVFPWSLIGPAQSATAVSPTGESYAGAGGTLVAGGIAVGGGTKASVRVAGTLTAGAAGSLTLQYAQNTSDATNTIPAAAGSRLRAKRIG